MADSTDITPQEAHRQSTAGEAVLVDVREAWEWEGGSAAGARRISLYELPQRQAELPRGQRVLCICASGNRSRAAADYLRQLGFDARSVSGGTTAWQMHRLPLEVA
jgi:rhodanese-related sulfurtransferase